MRFMTVSAVRVVRWSPVVARLILLGAVVVVAALAFEWLVIASAPAGAP